MTIDCVVLQFTFIYYYFLILANKVAPSTTTSQGPVTFAFCTHCTQRMWHVTILV